MDQSWFATIRLCLRSRSRMPHRDALFYWRIIIQHEAVNTNFDLFYTRCYNYKLREGLKWKAHRHVRFGVPGTCNEKPDHSCAAKLNSAQCSQQQ